MEQFDRYTSIFWDEESDPKATRLYEELQERAWLSSDFSIGEDRSSWVKIDANSRLEITEAMIISNTIKQSIGCVFLPLLNTSIGLEQIPRRAMISSMESRLNGEHSRLESSLIFELNSRGMVNKALKAVREREELKIVLEQTETSFRSMVGWSAAYESGIPLDGISTYDQTNLHIWRACALATVLLEVSTSVPTSLMLYEMQYVAMPQSLKAIQAMLVDISLITTYFAELAFAKYSLLPQSEQQKTHEWLDDVVTHGFTSLWHDSMEESHIEGERRQIVFDYAEYTVQKALGKLGISPKDNAIKMPDLIQKGLSIDADRLIKESEVTKKSNWFKRRK